MAKQTIVHASIASGLTFFILPALAEEPKGVEMTLGVEQRFEAGDNLGLENPEEGSTTLSTTSLTFGLVTETHNQSLSVSAGAKLRAGEIPANSDIDTGFVEPRLSFDYMREAANATLSLGGNYRESDISFTPAVSDFTDDTGVIVLPADFADLRGTGTRQSYNLEGRLETNINAPLSFVFDASVRGITYDQQTASLNDIFRYTYGARANLRFSEVTVGFASYNFSHFESEDAQNTDRDTHAIEVGVSQELSERASFEAAIGFSEIDETQSGIGRTTSGATGRISLNYDMPDGVITASYSTTRDQDGPRHNLDVGRTFELPRGSLSAKIGATRKNSSKVALTGNVQYVQELPTGSLRFGLNRNVSIDNDDQERITTTAELGYDHTINDISSIGFDMSFGLSEGNVTSDDTTRTDISASYNRNLTEDWRISTGVTYKVRDQDSVGKSDSTSIFVSLNRDFLFFR